MMPLIGITMLLEEQPARSLNILDQDYGKAVLQAGGIPVPILGTQGSIPDLVKQLDGFIFSGGDDIHPRFYREKPLQKATMTLSPDARTKFEMNLLSAVTRAKKPVLAICYGTQLVNVALGGSLYQDIRVQIPTAMRHGHPRTGIKIFHRVEIMEGTNLHRIVGAPRIRVRSAHHQSIKNPGKGIRLSALAPDGVIEAFEPRTKGFFIAVQWHPEKMLTDKYTKRLFRALVDASTRARIPKRR